MSTNQGTEPVTGLEPGVPSGGELYIVTFFDTLRRWRTIALIIVTLGAYLPFVYLRNGIDITNRNVTKRSGSLFTVGDKASASFRNITDVHVRQATILGWLTRHGWGGVFGYGTIDLQTAGSEQLAAEIRKRLLQSPRAFWYYWKDLSDNYKLDTKGREVFFYRKLWLLRQRFSGPFVYTTGYGFIYVPLAIALTAFAHGSYINALYVYVFWWINFFLLLLIRR